MGGQRHVPFRAIGRLLRWKISGKIGTWLFLTRGYALTQRPGGENRRGGRLFGSVHQSRVLVIQITNRLIVIKVLGLGPLPLTTYIYK